MSPKLQLDGSLTINSSSSLQASPRSLLPGLLPGPADKLTPKGAGQVCVWWRWGGSGGGVGGDVKYQVAGGGQWGRLEHSILMYFSC